MRSTGRRSTKDRGVKEEGRIRAHRETREVSEVLCENVEKNNRNKTPPWNYSTLLIQLGTLVGGSV